MYSPDAVDRAKADLAELNRKISVMDAEIMRMTMTKNTVAAERAQVLAFIKLWDKYTVEPTPAAGASEGAAEVAGVGNAIPALPPPVTESEAAGPPKGPKKRRGKRGKKAKAHRVPRKPSDTPTVPDMIVASLKAARAKGVPGLQPKGMTEFIAAKWWPHVRGDSIAPIAWRMARDKQLEKDGDIYKLPEAA